MARRQTYTATISFFLQLTHVYLRPIRENCGTTQRLAEADLWEQIANLCRRALYCYVRFISKAPIAALQRNDAALSQGVTLDGGSSSIHGKFRALNKTCVIRREEDNGFGNLVGSGWTPRWCLSG